MTFIVTTNVWNGSNCLPKTEWWPFQVGKDASFTFYNDQNHSSFKVKSDARIFSLVVDAHVFAAWASNGLRREIISGHRDPQLRWERVKELARETHFWFRKWKPKVYCGQVLPMAEIKLQAERFQLAGYACGLQSPFETLKADKLFREMVSNETQLRILAKEAGSPLGHRLFYTQGYQGPDADTTPSMLKPSIHFKCIINLRS